MCKSIHSHDRPRPKHKRTQWLRSLSLICNQNTRHSTCSSAPSMGPETPRKPALYADSKRTTQLVLLAPARDRLACMPCPNPGRTTGPLQTQQTHHSRRQRPLRTQRACMRSRSHSAPGESSAGRTSRCIATGALGVGAAL